MVMGRPTDCTPETTAKVCEALTLGLSWAAAAEFAGVSERSVMLWCERGRDGDEPYSHFLHETTRARVEAEMRMVEVVRRAAEQEGSVSAAQWWLERRRPETWGRKDKVETSVTLNSPESQVADALASLGAALDPKP